MRGRGANAERCGQATAETLMVLAFGIALLAVAISTANSLKSMQEGAAYSGMLRSSISTLAQTADEICILGEGNYRQVPMPQFRIALETDGNLLRGAYGNYTFSEKSVCNIEIRGGAFYGVAHMWHSEDAPPDGEKPTVVISNESIS